MPEPVHCHYCVGTPEIRRIRVFYNTLRKSGRHAMFRAECACGTIGKCRPTRAAAIDAWNEPWQARVGKHYLTAEDEA